MVYDARCRHTCCDTLKPTTFISSVTCIPLAFCTTFYSFGAMQLPYKLKQTTPLSAQVFSGMILAHSKIQVGSMLIAEEECDAKFSIADNNETVSSNL
jgi:hypothetical protein